MNKEKIRFVILKETDRGEISANVNARNFNDLGIGFEWDDFVEQVNFLVREKYLTKPFYADDTIYIYNSKLTEKGEKYLTDNHWYKKGYNFLKEAKDWIKL